MAFGFAFIKIVAVCLALLWPSEAVKQPCGDDFPWDDPRLPQTILPIHYDLVVHPNLTDFTFRGSVNIVLNVTEASDIVVLNSVELEIENLRLVSSNDENLQVSWRLCPDREQLAITVEDEEDLGIRAGDIYNLSMTFRGKLTDQLRGLYRSSYRTESGARK